MSTVLLKDGGIGFRAKVQFKQKKVSDYKVIHFIEDKTEALNELNCQYYCSNDQLGGKGKKKEVMLEGGGGKRRRRERDGQRFDIDL